MIPITFQSFVLLFASLFTSATLQTSAYAQDVHAGEKIFKKCKACHAVGDGAKNKVGPSLNGLFDRIAGSIDGYKFSRALKQAGADGLTWNEVTLSDFLAHPRKNVKGTKMTFPGLKKKQDRVDVIAYLKTFSEPAKSQSAAARQHLLGATAATLDGDSAYGEYLSGECVTCHQLSGKTDGIPAIVGWPKDTFIHALYEYKTNVRKNPVMRNVTGRLGDEEIAALAAYFGEIQQQ